MSTAVAIVAVLWRGQGRLAFVTRAEDAEGAALEVRPSWRGASHEVAAFIFHASNARIKQPNQGLTYSGIRFRVALD